MRIRSGYSFGVAYGFLEDVFARIETPFAPITDNSSTYGWNTWRKLCAKNNKKPIYGCEVSVTPSMNEKVMNLNDVTLIATTSLSPLNKAIELAFSQFRFRPVLSYNDLNKLDPSIAVIIGRRIDASQLSQTREWFFADSPSTPRLIYDEATKRGWRPIPCSDNLYPSPEDRHAFQLTLGRRANDQTWPQHILTEDELLAHCSQEAFDNRDELVARCTAQMAKGELVNPGMEKSLEEMCAEGAVKIGVDLSDARYSTRLERELTVIHKKEYEDYFFLISDMIRFAREEGIYVGPGRGSSAGSLVCYLLGITRVDPIIHGTLFERFLGVERGGWHLK